MKLKTIIKTNMELKQFRKIRGMTLVEVMIFIVLLSLLITNMVNYFYTIHMSNIKLMDDVHSAQTAQKGFIATTAVILLAMGTLAFLVATMSAVTSYADSVDRRQIRIQKNLNELACQETLPIVMAKDYFLEESVFLSDFGCAVSN